MKEKGFEPIFVKPSAKIRFKQLSAQNNMKMVDYFDQIIESNSATKIKMPFININFNNCKPKKVKGKKGNVILDTSLVLIVLVAVILGVLYLGQFNSILTDIVESDTSVDNATKQQVLQNYANYETRNDASILFIFGFLWIAVIASSFLIDANPIFFIISFILLIALLSAVMYFGNVTEEIFEDEFATEIPQYPYAYWIATHMLEVLIAISASIFISLFAKQKLVGE